MLADRSAERDVDFFNRGVRGPRNRHDQRNRACELGAKAGHGAGAYELCRAWDFKRNRRMADDKELEATTGRQKREYFRGLRDPFATERDNAECFSVRSGRRALRTHTRFALFNDDLGWAC